MGVHQNVPAQWGSERSRMSLAPVPDPYVIPGVSSGGPAEEERQFDILQILWLAVSYRWLLAACVAGGLAFGLLATWMQTPMYQSAAQLEVLNPTAGALSDLEIMREKADLRFFETARTKIMSRDLARRVVFDLELSSKPEFLAPIASFSLGNLVRRALGTNRRIDVSQLSPEQREAAAIVRIRQGLSTQLLRHTAIIEITYRHPSPEYAALVANQMAKSFVDQNVDTRLQSAQAAQEFVSDQVVKAKATLEKAEEDLVRYAEEQGLTLNQDQEYSQIVKELTEVNAQLGEITKERLVAEGHVRQISELGAASLPQVFESPALQKQRDRISELQASYQEKLGTFKPGFPAMRKLRAQIASLQGDVDRQVAGLARGVSAGLEQVITRENILRGRLALLEEQQAKIQRKGVRYTILKRDASTAREQYEALVKKSNEIGVGSAIRSVPATLVEAAQVPQGAYSPRLAYNLLGGLMVSLLLGAGGVYVLELLNNTFVVPDQVERDLRTSVLGTLPKTEPDRIAEELTSPVSSLSEAFRSLRTMVQFSVNDAQGQSILFTSSIPSEGKTTITVQVARDLERVGHRVLVIDADMRRPRLHAEIGIPNALGLSNLLSGFSGGGSLDQVFQRINDTNLYVLTAGTIPPSPTDLLALPKWGVLLKHLSERFDYVLVDAPPVVGLADAAILSGTVARTILVVTCRQVKRKQAERAIGILRGAGANIAGAVFNKFEVTSQTYNYDYRYTYVASTYQYGLEDHSKDSRRGADGFMDRARRTVAALLPGRDSGRV